MIARVAVALVLGFAVGCAHAPRWPKAQATESIAWQTLQSEHQVAVEFTTREGKHEQKRLRGAIAIERPGKLRLAALGPGGVRLFDLLLTDGQVSVLYAFRAMEGSAFGTALQSMARDLAAAYLLSPAPPERQVAVAAHADRVTITESDRTVVLSRFVTVDRQAIPTRIEASAATYHFSVDVVAITVDPKLDPQLFSKGAP